MKSATPSTAKQSNNEQSDQTGLQISQPTPEPEANSPSEERNNLNFQQSPYI